MYLIIDIGGTKTLIALFNSRGKIVKKHRFKTPDKQADFLTLLETAVIPFSVNHRDKIEQVIIAVPGWIENNVAVKFGNRNWKNLDLAKKLEKHFSCPITLENDANLATVYESSFHKGLTLYLTFSTGIGGGLARNGKLAKNSNSVEPGHTTYIFENKPLEWEDIASCAAIGAAYGCQATAVRGKNAYKDIAFRVSLGLPEVIQRYNPDFVIIGGPLGLQYPHFSKELKSLVRKTLPKTKKLPRIVAARRPKESVIYGGYLFAKDRAKTAKKAARKKPAKQAKQSKKKDKHARQD